MLLTACGTVSSSHGEIQLPQYGKDVQLQASEELSKEGPPCASDSVSTGCSAQKRIIIDCKTLRDQVRVEDSAK